MKVTYKRKVNRNPHGFIVLQQACNFDYKDIQKSCQEIIRVIRDNPTLQHSLSDCWIRSLEGANDFDEATNILIELKEVEKFTKEQIDQIFRIAIKNNQIRMCKEGKEFLKAMVKKYGAKLDPDLKRVFEEIKDSFNSPIPS